MAEVWAAAAITVVGGAVAGMGAEKKAKQDAKNQRELTKDSARYEAILSGFEREQDYYYQQLEKQEKMRGLDQFRQFSTLQQFAPNFQAGPSPVQGVSKPVIPEFQSQKEAAKSAVQNNQAPGFVPTTGITYNTVTGNENKG